MGSLLARVDRWQRMHAVVAFPLAVVRKFSDDNAGSLAALLSYYAFVATFPLLLVFVTVVELVLRDHPALQARLVDSALAEFPVIGDQLRSNLSTIHGTGPTLVLGLLVAFIGARGVAATFQRVCNTLWGVAYVDRPGFARGALRTLLILVLLFVGAVSGAGVVTLVGAVSLGPLTQVATVAASLVVTAALFLAVFRVATSSLVATRDLVRGAVASAVVWQLLLAVGTILVSRQLRHASALYGTFGVVLGLLAWFVLQATVTLYAIEADVVRARRLWPRGLRPPRTAADEAALRVYAHRQRRDENQEIGVASTTSAGLEVAYPPVAHRRHLVGLDHTT